MESRKYPPYLFDVDFDALSAPPEPEINEEPPAPTFSEADLQAARDTAFEAGRAEGAAQSNAGFEQQIALAVAALNQGFSDLQAAQIRANQETMHDTVRVAAAIAAKLFPDYAARHGLGEVEAFVQNTVSTLFPEAEVVLRVPEALAEEIATRLAPTAASSELGERLKIVADPVLGPADCRMEWGNGGAERNCARLLEEIDGIVARFIEHGPDTQTSAPDGQDEAPAETRAPDMDIAPAQDDGNPEAVEPLAADPSTDAAAAAAPAQETPAPVSEEEAPAEDAPAGSPTQDAGTAIPAPPPEQAVPEEPPAAAEIGPEQETDAAELPEPVTTPPAPPALPGAIMTDETKQND